MPPPRARRFRVVGVLVLKHKNIQRGSGPANYKILKNGVFLNPLILKNRLIYKKSTVKWFFTEVFSK
jgi:hypothetical protein